MTTESLNCDETIKNNSSTIDDEDDEEEFLIHMHFGQGEYSLRNDPSDIHLLGFDDNKCHIRIGDSIYAGIKDESINTSVIAQYDKETLNFDQLKMCHSRMLMEKLFIKPKNGQTTQQPKQQQQQQQSENDKNNDPEKQSSVEE